MTKQTIRSAAAAVLTIFAAASHPALSQTPGTSPTALPEGFDIFPFHSQVEFSVPFMGLARVKGSFEDFNGYLLYDAKSPTKSSITFVIQATSLHTGNALRDR